jgi:hypothetical protein
MHTTHLARFVSLSAVIAVTAFAAAGSRAADQTNQPSPASKANLALTAEVIVSSQQDGFPKTNAIDGDRHTEWAVNDGRPWIVLRWKEPVTVGRVVLCDRAAAGSKAQGGKILFGDAGAQQGKTVDVEDIPVGGAPLEVRFEPRKIHWLRLDLFSARGPHPGLAEIAVYADGETMHKPATVHYPAPGTPVTITEGDPRIWAVDGVREGKWSGAMCCPFAGTSVKLIGNTGPACGMADVYIDGIWQKTVDWYSEKPTNDATIFAAENLPDGKHLLGILTRGVKRSASQGTSIHWSRIEYVAGAHPKCFVPAKRTRFDPNVPLWLDTRGKPIQGHMGGIMFHDGKYYMLGSDWSGKPCFPLGWPRSVGFASYSSTDLMNWTYHCNSCAPSDDPQHPLYNYTRGVGRVRPLRAAGTGKFVALFQVVAPDSFGNVMTCEMNATAVAVADRPEGPYRWHGILQCQGKPVQGSDTAVFSDDDGRQYLFTALAGDTGWNVSDCLYQLAPDCLSAVKYKRLGTGGEAPAIFKHEDVYYLLHSHLTGLNTNDNFYHTATNLWGPWQAKGNIAQGEHSPNTFITQTMDTVPVAGKKGAFIWIGDSIRNNVDPNTRTVWLPVTIKRPGELELRWRDSWDLSVFGK